MRSKRVDLETRRKSRPGKDLWRSEAQTYLTRRLQLFITGQLSTLEFAELLGLFVRQLVSPFARLPVVNSSCLLCAEDRGEGGVKKWSAAPGRSRAALQSGRSVGLDKVSSIKEKDNRVIISSFQVDQQLAH